MQFSPLSSERHPSVQKSVFLLERLDRKVNKEFQNISQAENHEPVEDVELVTPKLSSISFQYYG